MLALALVLGVVDRFVQPDEFLVTGEGLVRNLMLGIRKAEALGGSSLVGYIPDSFGHIAQLVILLPTLK
jgi:alpha-mannosidase